MNRLLKRTFILSFIWFSCSLSAFSQTPEIKTNLDSNTIVLGKQTKLKYTITKGDNDVVVYPVFFDTLFGEIEIIGDVEFDSSGKKGGREVVNQSILITCFEEGLHYIPKQPFVFIRNNQPDTLYSSDSYLKVKSVEIDTTGMIRDIKNVEWVTPTFKDMLPYIIGIICLVLIVILIVYFYNNHKGVVKITQVFKPKESANVIALRELDKLKAQKLWQQQQLKEYYSRLTAIVRTYIEQQFNIKAMEESTKEIIKDISDKNTGQYLDLEVLKELLNLADLIKFAKGNASPDENVAHLENAYELVKSSHRKILGEQNLDSNEKDLLNSIDSSKTNL